MKKIVLRVLLALVCAVGFSLVCRNVHVPREIPQIAFFSLSILTAVALTITTTMDLGKVVNPYRQEFRKRFKDLQLLLAGRFVLSVCCMLAILLLDGGRFACWGVRFDLGVPATAVIVLSVWSAILCFLDVQRAKEDLEDALQDLEDDIA